MFKRIFNWVSIGVLLGFLSALTATVQARTLFIDFNNADNEIAAFKQHQQGVVSEVVVVPTYKRITPKQRLHVLKVNEAIEQHTMKVQDCAVAGKNPIKKLTWLLRLGCRYKFNIDPVPSIINSDGCCSCR